jgi:hypothetical protein
VGVLEDRQNGFGIRGGGYYGLAAGGIYLIARAYGGLEKNGMFEAGVLLVCWDLVLILLLVGTIFKGEKKQAGVGREV